MTLSFALKNALGFLGGTVLGKRALCLARSRPAASSQCGCSGTAPRNAVRPAHPGGARRRRRAAPAASLPEHLAWLLTPACSPPPAPSSAGTIAYFTLHPEELHMLGGDSMQVRWRSSQWDAAQVAQVREGARAAAQDLRLGWCCQCCACGFHSLRTVDTAERASLPGHPCAGAGGGCAGGATRALVRPRAVCLSCRWHTLQPGAAQPCDLAPRGLAGR